MVYKLHDDKGSEQLPQKRVKEVHKIAMSVPTLNAGSKFSLFVKGLNLQNQQPQKLLLIDSSSDDNTEALAKQANFETYCIPRSSFNHGGTRQLSVEMLSDVDIIVFLTQDAILAHPEALNNLLTCFNDPKVGAAYGRQLPRQEANPIEAHARFFNYPQTSQVKTINDVPKLGIKTVFISNSFAAYRRNALIDVGGFPTSTILSEDTYVAAKMLLADWKVFYCAEAKVYHSHHYNFVKEFQRYFDTGVFHAQERWIRENFRHAEGEGARFVRSELKYLLQKDYRLIPSAILRTILKFLGYKFGLMEKKIPLRLKIHLSMCKQYWRKPST